MSGINLNNEMDFIKGVKSHNGSLKILHDKKGEYIVEKKKYLLTLCISKKSYVFDSIEEAEDKFLDLRFGFIDGKFSLRSFFK
ncbi:MAG: hypothetical protein NTX22_04075 [Ignavibacteriales bacterium]|nr:hypothetical protein [Ignavibacteriales bacterium]